jgi:hypothetical protein
MHISYTESAPTSEPAKFGPYFGCPYWNSSSDQVLHSSSFLFGLGLGLLCNWRLFIESYNVTKFTGNLTSICYLWSLNFVTINALIYNEQTRSQMSEGTKRSRNPNTIHTSSADNYDLTLLVLQILLMVCSKEVTKTPQHKGLCVCLKFRISDYWIHQILREWKNLKLLFVLNIECSLV